MRNNDNSNYVESKMLYANLSGIVGLSNRITNNFLKLISRALLHRITEESLDNEGIIDTMNIEIPYVGMIQFKNNGDNVEVVSAELENEFKADILEAIDGKSFLLEEAEKNLVKLITDRYKSFE